MDVIKYPLIFSMYTVLRRIVQVRKAIVQFTHFMIKETATINSQSELFCIKKRLITIISFFIPLYSNLSTSI